jgi:hypothetical protein
MSRATTPNSIDYNLSIAHSTNTKASTSGVSDAFGLLMQNSSSSTVFVPHDRCSRPIPKYNDFYNPHEPEPLNKPPGYSLYANRQPLFDDRSVHTPSLPKHHTVAPVGKKAKTSWLWLLGYTLIDNSKQSKPTMWAYKLCMLYPLISSS